MEIITLRKVQLVQLEIAKEIKRVCDENHIRYFLTAGTLIGAIRHKGFIPWDDDLDMAMLKEDYDRFVDIAPKALDQQYELQTWHTHSDFPLEYGKVIKKGTVYIEGKNNPERTSGIYVDLIVYSNAPMDSAERDKIHRHLIRLHRIILMKCKYRPWYDNGKINLKKRAGYLYYQLLALLKKKSELVDEFEEIRNSVGESDYLFPMFESDKYLTLNRSWYDTSLTTEFENEFFSIPSGFEDYLTGAYGDYMKLPREDQRENRHQILKVDFGE